MGMHISYGLALGEEATFADAIEKITELHRYALTAGFLDGCDLPPVGEIKTGDGSEEWAPTFHVKKKPRNHHEQSISVPAIEWVGFSTIPGKGTESAYFGLARYPKIYRPTAKQSHIITVTKTSLDGAIKPNLSPIVGLDDGEWTYLDAARIERTATGDLLVRPCTVGVTRARLGLGKDESLYHLRETFRLRRMVPLAHGAAATRTTRGRHKRRTQYERNSSS